MKKLLSLLLVLACLSLPARAESNAGLSFSDDFDTYREDLWNETIGSGGVLVSSGSWMRDIDVENGVLEIRPPFGEQFLSSNLEFTSAAVEIKVTFNRIGGAVPIFYYLGFRGPTDSCLLMVQESSLVAVLTRGGKNLVAEACGNVEAGKTYTLRIERTQKAVEMFVDGKSVYRNADQNALGDAPMPVYLGANTVRPAAPDGNNDLATSAWMTIDSVKVDDLAESTAPGAPKVETGNLQQKSLEIENSHFKLSVGLASGVAWAGIFNKVTGVDYLDQDAASSPLFLIDEEGRRVTSAEFTVEEIKRSPDGHENQIILIHKEKQLRAVLSFKNDESDSLLVSLEIQNLGESPRELQTTFPVVSSLTMGGPVKKSSYFFPWRTGVYGKVDCNLTHEYGNLAWMQVVSIQDEKGANGFSVFPEDATGKIKGIHLKKMSGSQPMIRHTENVYPFTPRSPFSFREGLGVSYYYVPRSLAPQEKQSFPPTRIAVYQGGWQRALADYKTWTRKWYSHVKTPDWFYKCYSFAPKAPEKFWSEPEKRYINAANDGGFEDIVQWSMWHEYKDRSDNPSKNVLENAEYGDYEYNVSRGGLKTFVEEIRKLQAKGVRFTVYTDPRFCWQESKIGKAKGKEWAAMYTPGNYGYYATPDDKWMTSLYEPNAWADYYADLCERIIRDTGMDGIYLDELMIAFPNYNPAHTKFHEGESPVPVHLLAKNVTKIRDAMHRANPDTTVMVEHAGSDYMTQFIDGSWVQTFARPFPFSEQVFDENSLIYFRFLFPEFKLSEWGGSLDAPRRSLFNGIGVDINSYFDDPVKYDVQIKLIQKFRPIFHEVSDAFAGQNPEMLLPTLHDRLLANCFTSGEKQVYTLYNKSEKAVGGPALVVPNLKDHHFVELVGDVEVSAKDVADGKAELSLELPPSTVAVVANFPKLIELEKIANGFAVTGKNLPEGALMYLSTDDDTNGKPLSHQGGTAQIDRANLGEASKVIVKVMQDGNLLDQVVSSL